MAIAFPRRSFIAAVVVALAGCTATTHEMRDLQDLKALKIRLLPTSTRSFSPGKRGRFDFAITNQSKGVVRFHDLDIALRASPLGFPEVLSLEREWKYPMGRTYELDPGKEFSAPLVATHLEFPLGTLAPGSYEIRALACGRFVSEPLLIEVERPDLRGSSVR
jgi:hypothetical protein